MISASRAALLARVSRLEWMTTGEAALYCRVGIALFDRMVKALPIPFSRPAGPRGDRRFRRSDLDAALASRLENLPPAA